jgi:hypothetical protein
MKQSPYGASPSTKSSRLKCIPDPPICSKNNVGSCRIWKGSSGGIWHWWRKKILNEFSLKNSFYLPKINYCKTVLQKISQVLIHRITSKNPLYRLHLLLAKPFHQLCPCIIRTVKKLNTQSNFPAFKHKLKFTLFTKPSTASAMNKTLSSPASLTWKKTSSLPGSNAPCYPLSSIQFNKKSAINKKYIFNSWFRTGPDLHELRNLSYRASFKPDAP